MKTRTLLSAFHFLSVILICCVSSFGKSWEDWRSRKEPRSWQEDKPTPLTPTLPIKGKDLALKRKINNADFTGAETLRISFGGRFSFQDQHNICVKAKSWPSRPYFPCQ